VTTRLSPEAEADITAIADYVATENPMAADHLVDRLHAQCHRLGSFPKLGASRDDVRPGLRLFPVGNYLLLYREVPQGVEIVRVIYGARQWQALL
jgi:toxin ParE1/3/4